MLLLLASLSSAALFAPHSEKAFLSFMKEHGLLYTGDEYHLRLGIFLANARRVADFNRAGKSFKVALNKFACLTPAEYRSLLGVRGASRLPSRVAPPARKVGDVPESIDWREKNAVNPVKDQGQCGSCWAFSAVSAQESAWFINKGVLQSLSESEIVDCCTSCSGCNGGWPTWAYTQKSEEQDGLFMLEDDYPYRPLVGMCMFDKAKGVQKVTGYVTIKYGSEDDLKEKVGTMGPASICIDASQWTFQTYAGGIYDEPMCSEEILDHAVVCVGYGSEGGLDFWIVRNSWGPSWGENGYIRMIRNKYNQCGEASEAIVPFAN